MILKGFKRNALRKNAEKHLDKRDDKQSLSNLRSLAILTDATLLHQVEKLIKEVNDLGIESKELEVMVFKQKKAQKEERDFNTTNTFYTNKSFNLNGSIKNIDLQNFVKKEYDVLINFFEADHVELTYVAAASKAKFKVGLSHVDTRINDLIIGTSSRDLPVFLSELKKYLKILQII